MDTLKNSFLAPFSKDAAAKVSAGQVALVWGGIAAAASLLFLK